MTIDIGLTIAFLLAAFVNGTAIVLAYVLASLSAAALAQPTDGPFDVAMIVVAIIGYFTGAFDQEWARPK